MSTHGRRPASHAPAARPTAASSRTAATYGASRALSSTAMTSSTSEHGTPVKKSKPWRVSSVATSRPEITRALAQRHAAAAAHHPEELTERGKPHEGIVALLLTEGGRGAAVVVAGEEQRVVGQRAEAPRQRVIHLAGITARQVGAPARADEQRVAGDKSVVDEEALRAGRVPGRVQERQREPPDRQRVVVVDLHEIGAEPRQELALRLVDVDLEREAGEQLLDARDPAGHAPRGEAPADVILVRVRDQRAGEPHAVGLRGIDDRVDLQRGIDDDAFARDRIADEIDEVLHRPQLELLQIDSRLAHLWPPWGYDHSCYRRRREAPSADHLCHRAAR